MRALDSEYSLMPPEEPAPAIRIEAALRERFGTSLTAPPELRSLDELARIAEHRSHRRYANEPVTPELLELLFACALSAPSKSDLQQADIVHVASRDKVARIVELIPDMPWIGTAPVVLVFCGNNRRIRQIDTTRRRSGGARRARPHCRTSLTSPV